MSDESHHQNHNLGRLLRLEERDLVTAMLKNKPQADKIMQNLSSCFVTTMDDAGMGSIHFVSPDETNRLFGEVIAEAEFIDADGVLVSVTLSADNYGELYDMDFWKVNFAPIKHYPRVNQIRLKNINDNQ